MAAARASSLRFRLDCPLEQDRGALPLDPQRRWPPPPEGAARWWWSRSGSAWPRARCPAWPPTSRRGPAAGPARRGRRASLADPAGSAAASSLCRCSCRVAAFTPIPTGRPMAEEVAKNPVDRRSPGRIGWPVDPPIRPGAVRGSSVTRADQPRSLDVHHRPLPDLRRRQRVAAVPPGRARVRDRDPSNGATTTSWCTPSSGAATP